MKVRGLSSSAYSSENGVNQSFCVVRLRVQDDLIGETVFYNLSVIEDDNLVAELLYQCQIVADEEICEFLFFLQLLQQQYLALHKRAAALLAERGQYEKALEHLERSVRGTLRPAAEKRFHAFNERIRQFGESIEKDCCVAFENAPAEIKQQFHKIMDPITG